MIKKQRKYILTVQVSDVETDVITITDPLTLELDIRRATFSTVCTGTFRIYNLSQSNRNLIKHDWADFEHYRQVTLQAGYEGQNPLPIIFVGNVVQANSRRERTNFITEIECYSGAYAIKNSNVQTSSDVKQSKRQAIIALIALMSAQHVQLGAVSNFPDDGTTRGEVYSGSVWDKILALVPDSAQVFIDNEKVYVLNENDYLSAPTTEFTANSKSGLLETPRVQRLRIDIPIAFEPNINIGTMIVLDSLEKIYNGRFPCIGINHSGMISGAIGGKLTTVINVWRGEKDLTPVVGR